MSIPSISPTKGRITGRFGKRLRRERERRNLSQAELSERSVNPADPKDHISVSYVSALERNWQTYRVSQEMLDAIARGLDVAPWEVYEWAGWVRPTDDQSRVLDAITEDPYLPARAKDALREMYMALAVAPPPREEGASN